MHSLTYLSTIRKYYSSSSTSAYLCTRRHVGNSQKQHEIDRAKNGAKWQMLPNVGPTFSDMSPTCCPTHQCRVEIGDADIRQSQLSYCSMRDSANINHFVCKCLLLPPLTKYKEAIQILFHLMMMKFNLFRPWTMKERSTCFSCLTRLFFSKMEKESQER